MHLVQLGAATLASLSLAACATPQRPELDRARSLVEAAESERDVREFAPLKLEAARDELRSGEAAARRGADDVVIQHRAEMAQLRVQIARQTAAERAANRAVDDLGAKRKELILELRTQEAQDATARARSAQSLAERRAEEAESARAAAEAAASRASELERELSDLQAKETDRGLVLTLGSILFEVNRAELTSAGESAVARLASFLKKQQERKVVVEGHTDSTGSDAYNQTLSQRRAEAVRQLLLGQGIEAQRVSAKGLGESQPVASNDSRLGRQQNRRVEVVVLKPGEEGSG